MVIFRQEGRVGFATLNRPSVLNALSLEMFEALSAKLQEWERDPGIDLIVLDGAGEKGFCAGGDVKMVRHKSVSGEDPDFSRRFFTQEYRLDEWIHDYPKPILVFGTGIVMGGGLGLLAGAACRVVTETTVMAMPEITIGLFPDVGASYFLSRMPGRLGLYLGLTSSRWNAGDALHLGIADVFMASGRCKDLNAYLIAQSGMTKANLKDRVREFARADQKLCPLPEIPKRADLLNRLMESDDLEIIDRELRALVTSEDSWIQAGARTYANGSPTSARLIFEELRRAKSMSRAECFRMELKLALRCCQEHDFFEGVRALLVDKDRKPDWRPKTLREVTDRMIAPYFL